MNTNSSANVADRDEKTHRPPPSEPAPKCPRCDSGNTKFCYYNNYSLSQPRYFCKGCRRYWTKGGALRNVPVGGGCRKNKRSLKRTIHSPYLQLLAKNHVENSADMTSSSVDDHHQIIYSNNNHMMSNLSSPLSCDYSSAGTGESLSMAFASLQKQCDAGFEFDNAMNVFVSSGVYPQAPISLDHRQHQTMSSNLGFLNHNFGFENNVGDDQSSFGNCNSQPLVPYDDQLSWGGQVFDLMSGPLKLEMSNSYGMNVNDSNKILQGFPWQIEMNNAGASTSENHQDSNNNNNVVHGSGNNVGNGEVGESWNNYSSGLASWPNLINSALM